MAKKGGMFYSGVKTYRFCSGCHYPELKYAPLPKWCADNGITTDQARTLLKRRILLGVRHKSSLYVALHPEYKTLAASGYVKWSH